MHIWIFFHALLVYISLSSIDIDNKKKLGRAPLIVGDVLYYQESTGSMGAGDGKVWDY